MPRNFSFWLLIGIVAVFGILFFQIVRPFVVALFIAVVLAVLFGPVHRWLAAHLGGHQRIAAALTTASVIVVVLLPIAVTLLMAGVQVMRRADETVAWFDRHAGGDFSRALDEVEETEAGSAIVRAYRRMPENQRRQVRELAARAANGATVEIYDNTRSMLSNVFTFAVGLFVMTLGMYYLLADREIFSRELHRVLPLKNQEEKALTGQFERVCRGVVLATVVAGVVQSTLSGAAFAVLGVPNFWLLTVLTMFCSFVPFVGAGAVWGLVTLWLLFQGSYASGIGLAIYGVAVISTADNLVRAHVIGNNARLHPLVALVTVLGALKLVGLWGIFIGPMVAAFFYALLNIARERFAESDQGQDDQASLGAPWAQESPPAASNDPHLENLGFLR